MPRFKAICEIYGMNGKLEDYSIYVKEAIDEDDAESQAKYYMILERPGINFHRVKECVKI